MCPANSSCGPIVQREKDLFQHNYMRTLLGPRSATILTPLAGAGDFTAGLQPRR